MSGPAVHLSWVEGRFAVCRLGAVEPLPHWAAGVEGFISITRTADELSIIAPEGLVPAEVRAERGWMMLRVAGPLDFAIVGLLARLTDALARAHIPVFALSTFDTDYLLVKADLSAAAAIALGEVAVVEAR